MHYLMLTEDELRRIVGALQYHRDYLSLEACRQEDRAQPAQKVRDKAAVNSHIMGVIFAQTKVASPDFHSTAETMELTDHATIRELHNAMLAKLGE